MAQIVLNSYPGVTSVARFPARIAVTSSNAHVSYPLTKAPLNRMNFDLNPTAEGPLIVHVP